MYYQKTVGLSLITSLVFLIACCSCINSISLKSFTIVVEKTADGIKMNCEKGCSWTELTFTKNNYQAQAVDQNGMTTLKANEDAETSDFLFIIAKTDKQIQLKGLAGTAWTELSFSLLNNQTQWIDQNGMVEKK